jgi:hypothetical protein
MMSGFRTYFFLLATALCILPSCEKRELVGGKETVSVQLALSVGTRDQDTKGNPAIITEMSENVSFRGMTGISILPFDVTGAIETNDRSVASPIRLDDISHAIYDKAVTSSGVFIDGLVGNNWSHIYPTGKVSFPTGTASVLAYGYAPTVPAEDEIYSQHLNGALNVSGLGDMDYLRYAGDIHFNPVPIQTGNLTDTAHELADILNAILVPGNPSIHEIQYTAGFWYEDEEHLWHEESITATWNEDVEDLVLRECYQETINSGNLVPGSGRSIEYIITRLYRRLKTHVIQDSTPYEFIHSGMAHEAMKEEHGSVPLTWGDIYTGLQNVLIARIEALDGSLLAIDPTSYTILLANSSLRNYPGNLGLPDGAAIMRWNGQHFYPVIDMTGDTEEGVAPITSYCYPPRLWYFANSTLSTSSDDQSGAYTATKTTEEAKSWADILDEYHFGKIVSGRTGSVALDQPLQFSCGLLVATFAAATDELDDADTTPETTIQVGTSTFPITGVIVGSQQRLNFDFTPAGGREYFLYDNCFPTVYLPATPSTPETIYSFVSQTPTGEDVYLCLELRNDSGRPFTGADGIVLPGSKFYLVGNIEAPSALESVFQQDHTTTIHCTISSLKNALNAIPNLERPHIALGILISASWTMSTPGHVILS